MQSDACTPHILYRGAGRASSLPSHGLRISLITPDFVGHTASQTAASRHLTVLPRAVSPFPRMMALREVSDISI